MKRMKQWRHQNVDTMGWGSIFLYWGQKKNICKLYDQINDRLESSLLYGNASGVKYMGAVYRWQPPGTFHPS